MVTGDEVVRLIFEIFLLSLASTVRPTSLAAVCALLAQESRRRLLFAYVAGGMAFTLMFGIVVVGVLHGVHLGTGSSTTKAVVDIGGGAVALVLGLAILVGFAPRRLNQEPRRGAAPRLNRGRWTTALERRLTVPMAAVAGPLTHIPGVFYLIALNVIVANNPAVPVGILAVLTYDAVWFALPIAALATSVIDPVAAQRAVEGVQQWTLRNSRAIVVVTSFVVGIALLARGALSL